MTVKNDHPTASSNTSLFGEHRLPMIVVLGEHRQPT